jgi:hypothetical protein
MLRIADCESGLYAGAWNPTPIYNGEHATGLAQMTHRELRLSANG